MKRLFGLVILSLLVFSFGKLRAQEDTEGFLADFTYNQRDVKEREVVPYPTLRQADVMYARRIHRVVDSREKLNLVMNWPKNAFRDLIYNAVTEGLNGERLTAYINDSLISFYSVEEVLKRGSTEEVAQYAPDPNDPSYVRDTVIKNPFRSSDILRYRIMEDWIFDKQSSTYFPRIIAIAPLYTPKAEGVDLGEQPLFWVKWKELRKLMVNEQVYNRHNDAMRLTYFDFFEQRLFSSYIVKQPNEFDYDINDFPEYQEDPFAALLHSQEIKEELFNFEHDLWQY